MLHQFQSPAAAADGHERHSPTTLLSFDSDLDIDSTCSTPYVSAPSSPGRSPPPPPPPGFFYFSAPTSPVHFILSTAKASSATNNSELLSPASSFEFDFSTPLISANGIAPPGSMTMSSADELFLNGQIRPMKLSTHLERPQVLSPLLDLDETDEPFDGTDQNERGRSYSSKYRDKSVRRRTRSMSPLRTFWDDDFDAKFEKDEEEIKKMKGNVKEEGADSGEMSTETHSNSVSSSRSSSAGRSSKRWVFLKEFLHRSKSEGRNNNNNNKFWTSLSFSPAKEKLKLDKSPPPKVATNSPAAPKSKEKILRSRKEVKRRVNNNGKRAIPSAHVLHYTAKRAEAEEMRKRTFLPYRQGLLGCLGFNSKSYGAMEGFARALNPVSSR